MPDASSSSLPAGWSALIASQPVKPGEVATLPDAVVDFLADLKLLKGVPVRYLVPDGARLPMESIRFFHVDPTWTDRLVDGVFAAGSVGARDEVFSARVMAEIRTQVDRRLGVRLLAARGAAATQAGLDGAAEEWRQVSLSGLILRSELVQRWPGMLVRGYYVSLTKAGKLTRRQIATVRVERLGAHMLVALFAGVPDRVEIEEPQAGIRMRPTAGGSLLQRQGAEPGVQAIYQSAGGKEAGAFAASLVDPPFVAVFGGGSSRDTMQLLRKQVADHQIKIKLSVGGGA